MISTEGVGSRKQIERSIGIHINFFASTAIHFYRRRASCRNDHVQRHDAHPKFGGDSDQCFLATISVTEAELYLFAPGIFGIVA
ncbi:hypothetical protein KSC_040360 [Ktedonobacter sp. SOSP1-52]|nr:hypothetical protein KSC_040360 [Ktedonobacter sp. SOSP1-52]